MANFSDVLELFVDTKETFEDFGNKGFVNKAQGVLNSATAVVSFFEILMKKAPIGLDVVAFKANILKTSLAVANLATAIHENEDGKATTAEVAVQLVNLVGGMAGVVGSIPGEEFNPEIKISANIVSLEASQVSQFLETPSGAENFNSFWYGLKNLVSTSATNATTANTILVDFGITGDTWGDAPLSNVFAGKNGASNINADESFTQSRIDPAINELRVDGGSMGATVDANTGVVGIAYGDGTAVHGSEDVIANDNAVRACSDSHFDQIADIELAQNFSLTNNTQENSLNCDDTHIADYDDAGYDSNGYDCDGYDCDGYDSNGYDSNGYDSNGYDCDGYDFNGYDFNGYDCDGYDCDGYDSDGYDCDGYDSDGYDCDGYDSNGYDSDGYDCDGYDSNGYDSDGYDCDGYDCDGYDCDGYDSDGYDCDGYDCDGYDPNDSDNSGDDSVDQF